MKYNAIFRMKTPTNTVSVTVVGLGYLPDLGTVRRVPGIEHRFGEVVSVERDDEHACLRKYPEGILVEYPYEESKVSE